MARILLLSSHVARGYVGGSASQFVLQRLGHEVVSLPTTLLPAHPGHAGISGRPVEPEVLAEILDSLERNGWLGDLDAVLTGYLPSTAHVALAVDAVARLRAANPLSLLCCDPILGDNPQGLYIDPAAAAAIRDSLVPLAQIITPNRFEFGWLTGATDFDLFDFLDEPVKLKPQRILLTSAAQYGKWISTALRDPNDGGVYRNKHWPQAPHGTGDAMAALFFGHFLNSRNGGDAADFASQAIGVIVEASKGRNELALITSQDKWISCCPQKRG